MGRTEEGWMVKVWRFIKKERLWIFRILGVVSAPLYAACVWSISVTFLVAIVCALSEFDLIVPDIQLGIGLMMGAALLALVEMVRSFVQSMAFARRMAEISEQEFEEKAISFGIRVLAAIASIIAFLILAAIVVFIVVMISRALA